MVICLQQQVKKIGCFLIALLHLVQRSVIEATFVTFGNTLDLFLTSEVDRVDVKMLAPFPRCDPSPLLCNYLFNSDLDADDGEEATERHM